MIVQARNVNRKRKIEFDPATKVALRVHHRFHQLRAGLDLADPMRERLGPLGESIREMVEETLKK